MLTQLPVERWAALGLGLDPAPGLLGRGPREEVIVPISLPGHIRPPLSARGVRICRAPNGCPMSSRCGGHDSAASRAHGNSPARLWRNPSPTAKRGGPPGLNGVVARARDALHLQDFLLYQGAPVIASYTRPHLLSLSWLKYNPAVSHYHVNQ